MKLNKKYFFAIYAVLGVQVVFGLNFAYAICETEIGLYCKSKKESYDQCYKEFMQIQFEQAQYGLEEVRKSYKHENQYIIGREAEWSRATDNFLMSNPNVRQHYAIRCVAKAFLDSPDLINNAGSNQQNSPSSNQPSSSSSSSQSNKKANQQSANNQSSSSSSSPDSSNQTTNSNSAESSQQNSTPEDTERSNVRSYSAQQTAAYQEKYKGRGKKHNVDAVANQCIKTKGRKVINTCNFDVEVEFCAENPDLNSRHAFEMAGGFDCAKNSIGMWGIKANGALMGIFTADTVSVFACKRPFYPFAEYDHQKKTLVGRCGEL